MARGKKHTAEQVVNLLRQIEVGIANGIRAQVVPRQNAIRREIEEKLRSETSWYSDFEEEREILDDRDSVQNRHWKRSKRLQAHLSYRLFPANFLELRLRRPDRSDDAGRRAETWR
jgi:hypothetical protein